MCRDVLRVSGSQVESRSPRTHRSQQLPMWMRPCLSRQAPGRTWVAKPGVFHVWSGQDEMKCCANPRLALRPDTSIMGINDLSHDGQPEPRATNSARHFRFDPGITVENHL